MLLNGYGVFNYPTCFFKALDYPEYARPNFYIYKQKESGWARGVFLTTLSEIYHACILRLEIHFNARKREEPGLKLADVELSIKDVTGGEVDKKVNKQALDNLHQAVWAAQYFEQPSKTYKPYEIISFAEYALWFIRKEFEEQARVRENVAPRPRTHSYFHYLISEDAPFFDFPQFKAAFRELNFSIRNRAPFERIAENFYKAAKEITDLWNHHIFKIMSNPEAHKHFEMVRVEFKGETLKHSWWNDTGLFEAKPHAMYTNQDFVQLAAGIANLIADEVLSKKRIAIQMEEKVFLNDFVKAIQVMQEEEINLDLKESKKKEDPFRTWIWRWFKQLEYNVEREPLKGIGRIDLKVHTKEEGLKIIEFKGWWNPKRKTVIQQTCKYLTDFESDAYIFMINHKKENIDFLYRQLIEPKATYSSNCTCQSFRGVADQNSMAILISAPDHWDEPIIH